MHEFDDEPMVGLDGSPLPPAEDAWQGPVLLLLIVVAAASMTVLALLSFVILCSTPSSGDDDQLFEKALRMMRGELPDDGSLLAAAGLSAEQQAQWAALGIQPNDISTIQFVRAEVQFLDAVLSELLRTSRLRQGSSASASTQGNEEPSGPGDDAKTSSASAELASAPVGPMADNEELVADLRDVHSATWRTAVYESAVHAFLLHHGHTVESISDRIRKDLAMAVAAAADAPGVRCESHALSVAVMDRVLRSEKGRSSVEGDRMQSLQAWAGAVMMQTLSRVLSGGAAGDEQDEELPQIEGLPAGFDVRHPPEGVAESLTERIARHFPAVEPAPDMPALGTYLKPSPAAAASSGWSNPAGQLLSMVGLGDSSASKQRLPDQEAAALLDEFTVGEGSLD